jgi:hypothetical protein
MLFSKDFGNQNFVKTPQVVFLLFNLDLKVLHTDITWDPISRQLNFFLKDINNNFLDNPTTCKAPCAIFATPYFSQPGFFQNFNLLKGLQLHWKDFQSCFFKIFLRKKFLKKIFRTSVMLERGVFL